MTKDIPRCKRVLSRDEFFRLKGIHDVNPWLAYENVLGLYELWDLTTNEVQKELVEFLISHFNYIDSDILREACKDLVYHIENIWNLSPSNTLITAICDNAEPDGSQYILQAMKNKFSSKWGSCLYNSITTTAHKVKSHSNLVIIDDFIGTGSKVSRKVKYVKKVFSSNNITDIRIYVCTIAAMKFSEKQFMHSVEDLYSHIWLLKGISEMAPEDKKERYISEMLSLESKLSWKDKQHNLYSLGYKQSETLFSIESTNVPNNVFPIFWWKHLAYGNERSTILRRL